VAQGGDHDGDLGGDLARGLLSAAIWLGVYMMVESDYLSFRDP
jgi:hypothetical protein